MIFQISRWISRAVLPLAAVVSAHAGAVPTVGIEGRLEMQLPGTLLKAAAPERDSPLTVRIAAALPRGSTFHYDLRYIGAVPGKYDLRSYLSREDGSSVSELPPMPVEVTPVLPVEHQGQLAAFPAEKLPSLGGYRWMMYGLVGVWAVLGLPLFLARKKQTALAETPPASAPTLADRLRPLAELAIAGKLSADEKARFERMLLGHWRDRLGLDALPPQESIAKLRADAEGGVLLRALEDWLHRPPGANTVNLDAVLALYAHAPIPEPGV